MQGTHVLQICFLTAAMITTVSLESHAKLPPSKCEIRQSAWCILRSGATIEDRPNTSPPYVSTWILRGAQWPKKPLIVLEPYGCRERMSDATELLSHDKRFRYNGQIWNNLRVRLRRDGSCDIQLISPVLSRDREASAFFAGLTLVRACTNAQCDGPALASKIRQLVDP